MNSQNQIFETLRYCINVLSEFPSARETFEPLLQILTIAEARKDYAAAKSLANEMLMMSSAFPPPFSERVAAALGQVLGQKLQALAKKVVGTGKISNDADFSLLSGCLEYLVEQGQSPEDMKVINDAIAKYENHARERKR